MKKYVALITIIAVLWSAVFMIISSKMPVTLENKEERAVGSVISIKYREEEKTLLRFLEEHMLCTNGEILTNIKPGSGDMDTISESVGFLMSYAVMRNRKDLFDKEFLFLKKRLMVQDSYIRWRYGNEEVTCNAVIDDLRIAGALLDAYDLWQEKNYIETARLIQQALFDKQVSEGKLYEFYDWKKNTSKKSIPLCYIDLYNIYRLAVFNKGWLEVANYGLDTLNKGRIVTKNANVSGNNTNILFNKYYDYQTKKYLKDEEYSRGKGICLTYTIYSALNLANFNENTEFFTRWLKEEIGKGKLYAWYNPDTMMPAGEMESTAVYALAAVYSRKVGERELYNLLIDKMLQFRVRDVTSTYYGGFGNEVSGEFYSFDNLTALWALASETEELHSQ